MFEMETDDYTTITVTGLVSDQGTIVLFEGYPEDSPDKKVMFSCDHRLAQDIVDALAGGDNPPALVPYWAILG
jgi:hypothetical protein